MGRVLIDDDQLVPAFADEIRAVDLSNVFQTTEEASRGSGRRRRNRSPRRSAVWKRSLLISLPTVSPWADLGPRWCGQVRADGFVVPNAAALASRDHRARLARTARSPQPRRPRKCPSSRAARCTRAAGLAVARARAPPPRPPRGERHHRPPAVARSAPPASAGVRSRPVLAQARRRTARPWDSGPFPRARRNPCQARASATGRARSVWPRT